MVLINDGADVFGRRVGERVVLKQREHFRRALQQAHAEIDEPRVFAISAQGREPHLPIQPRLVRRDEARTPLQVPRFVIEFIRQPGLTVVAPFDNDLEQDHRPAPEQAQPPWQEDEERHDQLDLEHQHDRSFLRPFGQLLEVPGRPGRQRLRFVMEVKGGQVAPGPIAAEQLDAARGKHETKQQPANQPKHRRGRRPFARQAGKQPHGRKKIARKPVSKSKFERNQVDHAQTTKKCPADQMVTGPVNVISPEERGQSGEGAPMRRHQPIGPLRDGRHGRDLLIKPQRPAFQRAIAERAEDRFCGTVNAAIGLDQMHRYFQSFPGQFGKLIGNSIVLQREIFDAITGGLLPAVDPAATKAAVAIEHQQRLRRRRSDLNDFGHGGRCNRGQELRE